MRDVETFPADFEPIEIARSLVDEMTEIADAATFAAPFQFRDQWYVKDNQGRVRYGLPPAQWEAYRDAEQRDRRAVIGAGIIRNMRDAGIPERFAGASLDDQDGTCDGYRKTAQRLREMVNRPGMFALTGTRGGGKTHLSASIARLFIESGKSTRYLRAMDVFLSIRDGFNRQRGESQKQVVDALADVDLLILDELQVRSDTDFENVILTDLLDRRYAGIKSTILVANLDPKAFCERIGDSVTSRLSETGGLITCNWPSRRERRAA